LKRCAPYLILIALACLVAGGLYWAKHRHERRIRKHINTLERLFAKTKTESSIAGLSRAKAISGRFVLNPEIHVPPFAGKVADRNELALLIHTFRSTSDRTIAEVIDMAITVSDDKQTAQAHLTVRGQISRGGSQGSEVREMQTHWKRSDGDWFISGVRFTSAIRHPQSLL
jgi:hypothetical protein